MFPIYNKGEKLWHFKSGISLHQKKKGTKDDYVQ